MIKEAAKTSSCKLCAYPRSVPVFSTFNTHGRHLIDAGDSFALMRCDECGVFYLDDIVVDSRYYEKYYSLGYYSPNIKDTSVLGRILALLGKWSVKRKEKTILKHFPGLDRVSLLDVGCGGGSFLSFLDPLKFDRYGLEINKEGYELCRKKGLTVYNKNLQEADFRDRKFSVATLWHVLEHLEKPAELFRSIHKILSDDGIIVLQVPNTGSLGFKYGGQYWFHMDSPRHLMLYNKKSVERLCALTGFHVVEMKNEFYDYPQDLLWSLRKFSLRPLIYLFYPLVRIFSAEHLTFVIKKDP